MCLLCDAGVRNVKLLLVSGRPFTYMTNWAPRKQKMKKNSRMRSQRDIEEIRQNTRVFTDDQFVTLDTSFRLEITPVCTLHSI